MRCASCQKDLQEGADVIGIQEGIIGARGFVTLEDKLVVCSKLCLREYFADPNDYVDRVP